MIIVQEDSYTLSLWTMHRARNSVEYIPQDSAGPIVKEDNNPPSALSRTVLIADDNEDAAQTLALLLEMSGHRVMVAHDGEQAVARFDEFRPEFALLDIGMPKLDGYEVARRLRQRAGERRLTLVAATGWGQESDKARAVAAGFDAHFTKPIDPDQILQLLAARY
jgi:CheY-like chemotaxis protein